MAISVFDLFKVGIGPSSSHTVGPMRAAAKFAQALQTEGLLDRVVRVHAELYGSLSATGRGHGTDKAVLLGLEGNDPETVNVDRIGADLERIRSTKELKLLGRKPVPFHERENLLFYRKSLPFHPNAMRISAYLPASDSPALERSYYSIGGGFVLDEQEALAGARPQPTEGVPHPFDSGSELLEQCRKNGLSIAQIAHRNELTWRNAAQVREGLLSIWKVMQECVERGCRTEGILPGPLGVRRRAPDLYRSLTNNPQSMLKDSLSVIDWINLYALAVNEENAAGGRVVTAPTNGAAGIIPAILHYYTHFVPGANDDGVVDFLLTAGAIGALYKRNASISGAEVGCQGEVGVACSMAAGGLAAVMGGTPEHVEYAAEIGMEHNLGLTCDPIGGLVQVPCIERNAMGSIKALNAARMALKSDGTHFVSLDKVIKTMKQTGADMKTKYKETARGGLAVNVIEC